MVSFRGPGRAEESPGATLALKDEQRQCLTHAGPRLLALLTLLGSGLFALQTRVSEHLQYSCYTAEMYRTRPFRLIWLTVLFFFALLASGLPATADINPQIAPIVRALEDHYRNVKTLKAIFLERYSDGPQNIQLESGTVYFSRPGRMRWEYESPETKLFLVDGKMVWFYVPTDHTATRAPIKQSEDWRTPLALLTGKVKLRDLCDSIQPAAATKSAAGALTPAVSPTTAGNVILVCLPRGERHSLPGSSTNDSLPNLADPSRPFQRVLLEVNPATGELADVRVMQPGGIELEYRFGNWEENIPLDESLFHFQPPVGVAIVNQLNAANP
jgi:outer membrane lipoprotein carrier protein